MHKKIRVRTAPSPTGFLHLGTARISLFNFLFASQNNGDFILRIEDTDAERSEMRFEKDVIESLTWLDIKYDEFYRQSERIQIYKKYLQKLLENGEAFWCFHTPEEITKEREEQTNKKVPIRHVCEHKDNPAKNSQKQGVIRLRGNDKKIKFNDIIRGEIEFDGALMGDVVIAKNKETPLYNLAVVIDDYEMKISHVIRGEDHIPNTPKQILIHEALQIPCPYYAHVPMILGQDKSKLSKRHGATSINEYRQEGYLPEAMTNFMALLGWNPGDNREIFSQKELIKEFSLGKIQKSGAVFNIDKLNWFNSQYIKETPEEKLGKLLNDYVPEKWQEKIAKNPDFWQKIVNTEKPRLVKLSDIKEGIGFFFERPVFDKNLLLWKETSPKETATHIDMLINILSDLPPSKFNTETAKNAVWAYAEERGRGNVLWPFRVALTGLQKSPEPFGVSEILGQKETLERLKHARLIL